MIYNGLIKLFDSFLGDNKGTCSESGQIQYNCPECSADSNSLHGDGKFNLELNFSKGVFKCWKCVDYNNMGGRLSKLIRNYGSNELVSKYYSEIKTLNDFKLLKGFNDNEVKNVDIRLSLPKGSKSLLKNHRSSHKPLKYLENRGIGEDIIKKYNILYTDFDVEDKRLINRIIIPSFDKFGNVTYWVARKFDEFPGSFKYMNPPTSQIKKTDIVFNEGLINWDGDIRLVEGPFDHIVIPNSIPLLGKELNNSFALYKMLFERVKGTITLFLDNEAIDDTKHLYMQLNTGKLKGKVKYVTYDNFYNDTNLDKKELISLDPSTLYELYGSKGIVSALKNTSTFSELDLLF